MKKMEKKYIPLADFFQKSDQSEITLSYEAIENIMGQELPNAAYLNLSWWKKTKSPLTHYTSWTNSDYHVIDVKLGHYVTFSNLKKNTDHVHTDKVKQTYIIRTIESDDARAFINLQAQIFNECEFEYFNGDEQKLTVQNIRKTLLAWRTTKKSTILLCILEGAFVGYLTIAGQTAVRTNHVAAVRLGVLSNSQRLGIGEALLRQAETWCIKHGITRLETSVAVNNTSTIALFEKLQYEHEGIRKCVLQNQGQYIDELYYGKILK